MIRIEQEKLEARLNAVYTASEESEDALDAACPGLGALVSDHPAHENRDGLAASDALTQWLAGPDYITAIAPDSPER